MHMPNRFKLLTVLGVFVVLLGVTGSWVTSQPAGARDGVRVLVYNDVIRFSVQSDGVEILRSEIFDLGGRQVFDSGPMMRSTLDWSMTSATGERVAHGIYLYVITAWNDQGEMVKSQVGKLALVPGGVGLGQAPPLTLGERSSEKHGQVAAQLNTINDDLQVNGFIQAEKPAGDNFLRYTQGGINQGQIFFSDAFNYFAFHARAGNTLRFFTEDGAGTLRDRLRMEAGDNAKILMGKNLGAGDRTMTLDLANKRVGIGAVTTPGATLDISGSVSNLIRATNSASGQTVFRVESDGDVFADRSYNCGLASGCFNSGQGADVAERIDATEALEPGDVVEIDPSVPGQFRKPREGMSRRVAGVISTAPAITLGNNFDSSQDKWEDNRPLLALAGRVPVKVIAKFGAIEVGDLLISSPIPGYAMKCPEASECIGAIIGKALEPWNEGAGKIEAQVMLR